MPGTRQREASPCPSVLQMKNRAAIRPPGFPYPEQVIVFFRGNPESPSITARGVAGASQRGGSARIPARGPCARNGPSRPEWGPAAKRWACVPFACGAAPYSGKEGRHPFAEEADSQSPSIRVPKPGWVSRKALVPSSMAQPVKLTWELSSTWRKSPPRFSKAHSRKSAEV